MSIYGNLSEVQSIVKRRREQIFKTMNGMVAVFTYVGFIRGYFFVFYCELYVNKHSNVDKVV